MASPQMYSSLWMCPSRRRRDQINCCSKCCTLQSIRSTCGSPAVSCPRHLCPARSDRGRRTGGCEGRRSHECRGWRPSACATWSPNLAGTPHGAAAGLFALSPSADLQQLAMLRVNPPTAALCLSEFVTLEPGDWVVQDGGTSAVARGVIAIAKARGLKTVSIVRRPESIRRSGRPVAMSSFSPATA